MSYSKTQVQGLRADGKYPLDGKVKSPHKGVKEPLAHTGPIYESEPQHANNIARGGAPKKLADVAIHSGQHSRTRDGALITGQTQTSLANAPDASGTCPLDPTETKHTQTEVAQPVIGQRSRTQAGEVTPMAPGAAHGASAAASDLLHAERHANAARMGSEAVLSGSTNLHHPAHLRRR